MEIDDLFCVFGSEKPITALYPENVVKQEHSSCNNVSDEDRIKDYVQCVLERKRHVGQLKDQVAKKPKVFGAVEDIRPDDNLPRIQVHTVNSVDCLHEVAVPPDMEFRALKARTGLAATEYNFPLDPFQKEAILCLENNESVLVSAHTSSGKTVVAEYAIALSLRNKQRVIYTTPIKALSNQKYREFYESFKDVGLMTGDVTINPSASCLIMTTEILRSMLYRGSEVMREVGWVVFDEIHYMRDKSRGVVWEETIILLPDFVHYVFLSATIPNAVQFAEWICHLHGQPCHVVYSEHRPVPLQQYIFPVGGDGLYLVVDERGSFHEENFNSAMNGLQLKPGTSSDRRGRRGGVRDDSDCYKLVKMIMERNFSPAIIFSFSKKECEAYAMKTARLEFNNDQEKQLVEEVFKNAMDVLSEEDKNLPQVINLLPMLKRGIGIHHGGLLPILKETVEILFSEGLIKTLFATETFAMGLNMPARTVLFTNARKFDGKDFRWITSGEYIQMSGRAGRRGIDDRGVVILMVDEKMSPSAGKEIVKGQPDRIDSAFHLTYNMVLNLLRVEEINPEYMLERSFFQFQKHADIPSLYESLKKLCDEYDAFKIPKEDEVGTYYRIIEQLKALEDEAHEFLVKPENCLRFLQPGRMVEVVNGEYNFGWGIVINYQNRPIAQVDKNAKSTVVCVVDVLIHVSAESAKTKSTVCLRPPLPDEAGEMQVVSIKLDLIRKFSSVRVYYPKDLRPLESRMTVLKTLREVINRFSQNIPLLDPIKEMKIKDIELHHIIMKIESFKARMKSHPQHEDPDKDANCALFCKKQKITEEIKTVKEKLRKAKSLLQMDELKCRKRVLRRMGFCSGTDVMDVKGRVACEISSADELLLTEMIFNGVFNNLNVHQTTALLSCFVFEEKSSEMPKLTEELSGPLHIMQETAKRIAKISKESKLEIDAEQYIDSFKPHLMDVVFAWSKGCSFDHICKMTDVFEGSIIRCMRRLEELLRQMCQAAKAIGNSEMENKFAEGIRLIKRDIVFAASLYL